MSTFFTKFAEESKRKFLSHVRPEIQELAARGDVHYEEYSSLRMNSYEQSHLYPHLTTFALKQLLKNTIIPNCTPVRHNPPITYDEALQVLVEILLERI